MPRAQRNPCVFICYAVISHQSDVSKNSKSIVQSPNIRLTPDTNQLGGGVEKNKSPPPPPLWRLEETMSGEESSTERDRKLQPDSTPDLPPSPRQTDNSKPAARQTRLCSRLIAAVCLKCKDEKRKKPKVSWQPESSVFLTRRVAHCDRLRHDSSVFLQNPIKAGVEKTEKELGARKLTS